MRQPTASTQGILGPNAVGRVFSLRRSRPAADATALLAAGVRVPVAAWG